MQLKKELRTLTVEEVTKIANAYNEKRESVFISVCLLLGSPNSLENLIEKRFWEDGKTRWQILYLYGGHWCLFDVFKKTDKYLQIIMVDSLDRDSQTNEMLMSYIRNLFRDKNMASKICCIETCTQSDYVSCATFAIVHANYLVKFADVHRYFFDRSMPCEQRIKLISNKISKLDKPIYPGLARNAQNHHVVEKLCTEAKECMATRNKNMQQFFVEKCVGKRNQAIDSKQEKYISMANAQGTVVLQ